MNKKNPNGKMYMNPKKCKLRNLSTYKKKDLIMMFLPAEKHKI
jgi:hypothetical protein